MAFLDYSAKRMGPARLTRARGLYARRGKRIFDLVICFALLPVVAPAILVLWLLAMMTGPTGFFAHARVGKNGKAFRCWKIRTMIADADDALIKLFHRRPEACLFRGDAPTVSDLMRPPIPILSAHRFRGIRPPL